MFCHTQCESNTSVYLKAFLLFQVTSMQYVLHWAATIRYLAPAAIPACMHIAGKARYPGPGASRLQAAEGIQGERI